ncbi:PAS-domain containing protein [Sphingomonas lutea]|uniref:PAS-domain containing protein n=1 Tax=Sphingomonas lutea TaxID=1045317 RepID=A0A7G9SG96_9SPHN|nr:PAS-domain containing protein [Sphingomonas lutea]
MIELRIGSRVAEERKKSLERQSELLRATIDHVQQGIGVFDSDLKLVLWNDLLFDLLELPGSCVQKDATLRSCCWQPRRRAFLGQAVWKRWLGTCSIPFVRRPAAAWTFTWQVGAFWTLGARLFPRVDPFLLSRMLRNSAARSG